MKFFYDCQAVLLLGLCLSLSLVTAQNRDCFCGGRRLPNPSQKIKLSETAETTCRDLQEDAANPYLVRAYGCNYYQFYGHLCGCNVESSQQGDVCQLCQDGQRVDVISRDGGDVSAVGGCQQLSVEARFDPFGQGCGYYHYMGAQCGCQNNKPPADGCTVCADGSDPPLASRQVRLPGVDSGACVHVNEYTQYDVEKGSRSCVASQATFGGFCGCDESVQPVSDCPICGTKRGLVLSNDPAPTFSYLSSNGETTIYQSGRTCLEAELLAHELFDSQLGPSICTDLRKQLTLVCCKDPNKELLSSATLDGSTPEDASNAAMASSNAGVILVLATIASVWQMMS